LRFRPLGRDHENAKTRCVIARTQQSIVYLTSFAILFDNFEHHDYACCRLDRPAEPHTWCYLLISAGIGPTSTNYFRNLPFYFKTCNGGNLQIVLLGKNQTVVVACECAILINIALYFRNIASCFRIVFSRFRDRAVLRARSRKRKNKMRERETTMRGRESKCEDDISISRPRIVLWQPRVVFSQSRIVFS
jgi:hypothetical protein